MRFRRPPAGRVLDAAFFAGLLAYVYFGIDTRLIYHWQAPVFYMTAAFAAEFLRYPGGFADYIYRFIAQTYASAPWGALALSAQVAAVTALTRRWCRPRPLLRFVPALLLLYSVNLYYEQKALLPALLLALIAAVPLARAKAPLWVAVVLLPVFFYLGGMAVVFFAALVVGIEIGRRRYGNAALLAGVAVALVIGARVLHAAVSPQSWFVDADIPKIAVWWGLYAFCAVVGFAAGRPLPGDRGSERAVALRTAAVIGALAAVAVVSYRANARDRRLADLDYHTSHENWQQVIDSAVRLPAADFNSLTRYEVNLALYETNRLGDEIFRFPQTGSTLPSLRTQVFLPYMLRVTDLFLRLGRIDDAEHFGNEAMILGHSDPRVFRMMAEIHLVKGQAEAARKYLAVLASETGSARWARGRLREIDEDPQLSRDAALERRRRTMLLSDDVIPVWQNPEKPDADVDRLLLSQLERDPSNRMAFEFLMGNYLLARNLDAARSLVTYIAHMTGPAYETPDGRRRTPRCWQEAMAMYTEATGRPVEVDGVIIESETLNRMAVFKRILAQSGGKDAAMQAAWDAFRGTYFFYYVFGPGDYR
jgi:hypothetical protein